MSDIQVGKENTFSRTWEQIDPYTDRLCVPNGWLVRSQWEGVGYSQSMVFRRDPIREWVLEPKPTVTDE